MIDSKEYEWVSCAVREFGPVGIERHLVRRLGRGYQLTTLCNASASLHGIWRKDTRKPKCETCRKIEA